MFKNIFYVVLFLYSSLLYSNDEAYKKIVDSYIKIAYATYQDSLISAKSLGALLIIF